MRTLKFVVALLLVTGVTAVWSADKEVAGSSEAPKQQTASISGTLHPVSDSTAKGAVAELHVLASGAAKSEAVVYSLFADGSTGRKLKDLASKGATVTVSGVITEKGYQVTSFEKGSK